MKRQLFLCAALAALLVTAGSAGAAELEVLSSNGARSMLAAVVPQFERTTHNKVTVSYGEGGILRTRILDGEAFDLTILSAGWETLQTSGKIAGSPVSIAHTDFGMAVRAGAPKPNTSSVDGLKRTLLAAKSIVYTDPKTGGISGVLFARVIGRLGIADEINKKSKLSAAAGVFNAQFVVNGEADLAVQLASEILAVPGAQFVPMPPEFQTSVGFSGAIAARSKEPAAAKALLQFLITPAAAQVIKAKGYTPG
jgi:molybdate transport system substrate-binding protein